MEPTAHVSQRLQQVLEHYQLTARQAAVKMGDEKSGKIYKLLSGDAKPGFDTLTQMLEVWPELSADWLVMGRGPMVHGVAVPPVAGAKAAESKPSSDAWKNLGNFKVLTVTVDRVGKENTLLVPLTAQAGYPSLCNEAVYLQDMHPYHLPGFEWGTYRAFEVSGTSMSPTFGHKDIVVCSVVDRKDLLKPWECYVIVTSENLLLKRISTIITDADESFELHSDNPGYEPYRLPVADIQQLWMVRGYLSTSIPARPLDKTVQTMERLQEVIELLGHDYHEVRRFLEESTHNAAQLRGQ
ncbi:hypothetical protein GCM10022407_03290 [Hymenobacter antarcticus]|uniref:Peptidase S24/S26A/S26B/S26C domain-containing protein n=2 Tax=Hymenobacter antarcticus TaxID=486270 RepID=A0ABP7P4J5_9BACT